ncbi:MAG: Uma2 family endonuclease [Bacteroidetes bacterium]|nr:MAG: Uma2 family endonuclease [Bacteroidota bacterium]
MVGGALEKAFFEKDLARICQIFGFKQKKQLPLPKKNQNPMKIILNVQPLLDLSDDQLMLAFSALNPNLRLEVNRFQKLIIDMPTHTNTGNHNSLLNYYLTGWNMEEESGKTYDSSTGFRLPETKSLLSPDMSWIENSRLEKLEKQDGYFNIAPDFVGELRSDSDTLNELKEKMEEYIENGVRLGWLIDPKGEKVYIYRLNKENSVQSFEQKLSGEDVLPNFEVDLLKIFKK